MRYQLLHETIYRYSETAALSLNELCLIPRVTPGQSITATGIRVTPSPEGLEERADYFGNTITSFMVQEPHQEMIISAKSIIVTQPIIAPEPNITPTWEQVREALRRHDNLDCLQAYNFTFESPMINFLPEIRHYARQSFADGIAVLTGALHLTDRIFTDFTYEKEATTVDTPIKESFQCRKGVCQDFAHIMICCLRSLGLAARYVSGYLETIPPPGKEKLVGSDASHAWLSLFIPGFGWVDLDPTNNLIVSDNHITLAWGRDYSDVIPVKGVILGGGGHALTVKVDVSKLPE